MRIDMKAVIRGDKGTYELGLYAESYDEAVLECVALQEDGFLYENEEVIAIIE